MSSSSSPWRAFGKCRILMNATKTTTTTDAAVKPLKGLSKPMPVTPALQKFIGGGATECSRAEALKKVWAHIKANNLQNPEKKKEIICDQKLKTITGKDKIDMMEISRLLSPHFIKSG